MTRYDKQRLDDILAAIIAISEHLERGSLADGLVFDAVRVRLIQIGEAVKALPDELLDHEPALPWPQIARMRDQLEHRHAIVSASVAGNLHELDAAVRRLLEMSEGD